MHASLKINCLNIQIIIVQWLHCYEGCNALIHIDETEDWRILFSSFLQTCERYVHAPQTSIYRLHILLSLFENHKYALSIILGQTENTCHFKNETQIKIVLCHYYDLFPLQCLSQHTPHSIQSTPYTHNESFLSLFVLWNIPNCSIGVFQVSNKAVWLAWHEQKRTKQSFPCLSHRTKITVLLHLCLSS